MEFVDGEDVGDRGEVVQDVVWGDAEGRGLEEDCGGRFNWETSVSDMEWGKWRRGGLGGGTNRGVKRC